jgi:hypothetical protein
MLMLLDVERLGRDLVGAPAPRVEAAE